MKQTDTLCLGLGCLALHCRRTTISMSRGRHLPVTRRRGRARARGRASERGRWRGRSGLARGRARRPCARRERQVHAGEVASGRMRRHPPGGQRTPVSTTLQERTERV
jgi:hypothetical protein